MKLQHGPITARGCLKSHAAEFLVEIITRFRNGTGETLLRCDVRITLKRIKNGAAIGNA